MTERRHEPRVKAVDMVHVEEYRYPTLEDYKTDDAIGRTLDLSHDGMRLELDHCIPLRSRVKIELAFGEQVLHLNGKVRSIREIDEKGDHWCDHGIEFIDVTPEQYEALEEHLQLHSD